MAGMSPRPGGNEMTKHLLLLTCAVGAISSGVGVAAATAADTTSPSATEVGAVIVTAEKRQQNIQKVPVAVTGGAEAVLTVATFKGWEALRVLTTDACRPFSRTRSGIVLGEGAAMLVLERRDDAVKRGARIYAELLGFGMSTDAGDIVAADAGGAARAMMAALADAELKPDDIDYVNAHGTGTVVNDKTESDALRRVFGTHAKQLGVSSCKAVLGNSLGASGALELVATALALENQVMPPTANFQEPDPDCALDFVPNVARKAPIRHAMSNSFAFGGLNAVIVLGRA